MSHRRNPHWKKHPGKHLSIDNRFSELSLDESSWVAESESQLLNVPRTATKEQHRKKIRQDKVQMPKANFYVTSPFKQGSERVERGPVMAVDPSHDLKQRTLAGVSRVKKQLNQSKRSKQFSRPPSHLQRGYGNPGGILRPLGRPVTTSGPLMRNCQGIVAGARSHRSFSRQADSSFHRNFLRSCSSGRPASPTELLRPEGSIHNTSCASSIADEFGNDDGESFSENEIQDRIDAVNDIIPERNVFSVPTDDPVDSSKRKRSILKNNGCRIYCEGVEGHSDHDSDDPEGTWARQSSPHSCNRNGNHGKRPGDGSGANVGNNKVQGRRRNADNTSYDTEPSQLDRFVQDGLSEVQSLEICSNCSLAATPGCKDGNGLRIIETQRVNQQMAMHVSGNSQCANVRNANNTHVKTCESGESLTMPKTRKPVGVVRGIKEASSCTLEYLSFRDFFNENLAVHDNRHLDSDPLDTDRMSSADIFEALENLNLSMSATEPSTSSSNREGNRGVKSAAHVRKKSSIVNSAGNRHRSNKYLGRVSAKHGNENKYNKCSGLEGGSHVLPNSINERVRGLAEALPGYFTQQYKQLLQEENGISEKHVSEASFASADLPLVSMEKMSSVGNCRSERSNLNETMFAQYEFGTDTSNASFEKLQNSTPSQTELSKGQNRYFDKKTPMSRREHSQASAMFVTMDRENSLTRTEEDIQCGEQNLPSNVSVTVVSDRQGQEPNKEAHLEIIATAKVLSESRCSVQWKQKKSLPPVSFTINAKPPLGQLYYFAYGPEMSVSRMAIYLRREPKTRLWGILFGFRLLFNKKGSSAEAGGFANVEFSPEDSVEGCVYCLTDAELTMLDNCMGYPKHYTRVVLPVWMLNCTSPSQHGVAQFCVPAVLYIAHDEWVVKDYRAFPDCSYAVNQCLKARDILTPNYVQFLCSQTSS